MKRKYWEEIIIALSLANLLFIAGWRRLLYPSDPAYNIKFHPTQMDFFGMLLTVIFTAGIFLGGLWLARYLNKGKVPGFIKWIYLFVLLIALFGVAIIVIKSQFWIVALIGRKIVLVIALIFMAGGIIFFIKQYKNVITYANILLLILSPLILITFSQSVFRIASADSSNQYLNRINKPAGERAAKPGIKSRVVWIIFDELGYRFAFEDRPADLKLPELDRLKQQSIFATDVRAPERNTIKSIPALLIGKKVKDSEFANENEILITFAGGNKKSKFSEEPNIFTKVKEMGGDSAVIGWYHPYCRIFARYLSTCQWETRDVLTDFETKTLFDSIVGNFRRIFNALPAEYRALLTEDREYLRRHNAMVKGSIEVASDPNIDLAFLHLPVPHYPNRYNRNKKNFRGSEGYIDNLALTDYVLGEIRREMEKNNLWDNSVVIVSSDHQWRIKDNNFLTKRDVEMTKGYEDPRIPLLIKLKNQNELLTYEKPLNAVITQDIILALLKGEISKTNQVINWLDLNAAPD